MKRIAFAVSPLVALSISTAAADGMTPDGPLFDSITLDRQSPVSKIDLDFGFVVYDTPNNVDFSAIGFTLGGQYVEPRSGLGVYGAIPLSHIALEITQPVVGTVVDDSALMLGNVELGGIYSKWMSSNWALVLHGGLALPTANDEDDLRGYMPAASSPRYIDLVQRTFDVTWFRLGVSPQGRAGGLFWRADLGIDVAINDDDDTNQGDISPIIHVGFAGGFDLGKAQLLAELAFLTLDDDTPNDNDDDTTGTLALGVRFDAGKVFPGLALILPLEFDRNTGPNSGEPEFAIALSLAAHL